MSQAILLESIRLEEGQFSRLEYHADRMNKACATLGITNTSYELLAFFKFISVPKKGLWKCRLLYDERIKTVHFQAYNSRSISSLKIVRHDTISYPQKLVARDELDKLYSKKFPCDDIIIIKQGMVTDSYYGNLLFLKAGIWYTPDTCLLKGTMRQSLLDTKQIVATAISEQDIHNYERVKIINAMLDLKDGPEVDIDAVVF